VLCLAAAFLLEPLSGKKVPGKAIRAKAMLVTISNGLELYKQEFGSYPTGLQILVQETLAGKSHAPCGPFIDPSMGVDDPWDRPFSYSKGAAAVHNPRSFDLWSAGKDGVSGNADDITNWP